MRSKACPVNALLLLPFLICFILGGEDVAIRGGMEATLKNKKNKKVFY